MPLVEPLVPAPEVLFDEVPALPLVLPESVPVADEVLLGVVVSVEDDEAVDEGGVVTVVLGAVVVLELLAPFPFPVRGRSQPVTAAVANARTATTGMSFFMGTPFSRGLGG